jgi:hypothetical protein
VRAARIGHLCHILMCATPDDMLISIIIVGFGKIKNIFDRLGTPPQIRTLIRSQKIELDACLIGILLTSDRFGSIIGPISCISCNNALIAFLAVVYIYSSVVPAPSISNKHI